MFNCEVIFLIFITSILDLIGIEYDTVSASVWTENMLITLISIAVKKKEIE